MHKLRDRRLTLRSTGRATGIEPDCQQAPEHLARSPGLIIAAPDPKPCARTSTSIAASLAATGGDNSMTTPNGSDPSRRQQPLLCNKIASMVDRLIGTERRTRVG